MMFVPELLLRRCRARRGLLFSFPTCVAEEREREPKAASLLKAQSPVLYYFRFTSRITLKSYLISFTGKLVEDFKRFNWNSCLAAEKQE